MPSAMACLAARDLESHGFFLSPFLQPGFRILDAGCGPGTITAGIAEAVFPGTVIAVDVAPGQLEYARRLAQGREIVNLDFTNACACALPFPAETFDLVFAHALIEHLSDPRKALREFHRVARSGGFVVVCSPDWDAFEFSPYSDALRDAILVYRNLQEQGGGNMRAGALLTEWIAETELVPLAANTWLETHDEPRRIGECLASTLEAAGKPGPAGIIRRWMADSSAEFRLAWNYATTVKVSRNCFSTKPVDP